MNHRLFSLLLFCLLAGASLHAQMTAHAISGRVEQAAAGERVHIARFDPVTQDREDLASTPIDTANGNRYQLYFPFAEPDLFELRLPGRQTVLLAIDTGQTHIELNAEGKRGGWVEIQGSPDSELLQQYEAFRKESYERLVRPTYDAMKAAGEAGNRSEEIAAVAAYAEASEAHRRELLEWTEKHIGTSIALYGTMLRWTGDSEIPRLEKLVSAFAEARPDLNMTHAMQAKLERFKKVALGAPAPALTLPDTSGQEHKLHELRGTVTLLDFWASWCSPCLRQIPDLKEAYAKWHERGFEIIGISVDSKAERWKAAIRKYEMNWPQLSDVKGWASRAAAEYNVTFIPFNFLLDAEGRILAKNLHSGALDAKLAELLGGE